MFYIYADGQSIYQPPDETMTLISPKLTLEMGKAGSLEFSVPPTHKFYNQLRQLKTLITVELDDVEIFRGRVLSNTRDFNNIRTVYCEGDLAYLIDSVQKGEKYNGTTHKLFRKIIEAHNARVEKEKQFTVGNITIEDREIILTGQSDQTADPDTGDFDYKQIAINSISNEWNTSFDYIESCIIDYCGGYLRTRRVENTTYIDLLENYGKKAAQEIEFGVNMLDLTEEVTAEELFTVLIPLGDENLTIASVNDGSDELVDKAGVEAYGRIVKTQVFDNVNKASTLLENGKRFLESHANIPITFTIRAVDMHLVDTRVEEIYVGDVVHVNSMPHELAQDLTCTKVEYDIENPSNDVYTFGNPKQTLTERYRKDKNKSNSYAGGAAGGAGKAAEEKTNELLDKFFDAWINVDKESAHINLGALYQEFQNAKKVLENQVGIDLNAVTGNINIKALKTKYDELEQVTRTQAAQIDLLTSDTESKIELLTSWYDYLEGREDGHYASIVLRANELESAIEMKADRVDVNAVNVNLNALTTRVEGTEKDIKDAKVSISAVSKTVSENGEAIRENSASITALANDTKSQIRLLTNDMENNFASLTLTTTNLQSSITGIADRIVLLGKEDVTINSKIVNINSDIKGVKELVAKKLTADELASKIGAITTLSTKNIINNGYLHTTGAAYLDGNVQIGGTLTVNGAYLATKADITGMATQKWVKDYLETFSVPWKNITGRPTYFPAAKHRHSIGTSSSNSTGVSTNATHTLTISGTKYTLQNGHQHKYDKPDSYTGYTGG